MRKDKIYKKKEARVARYTERCEDREVAMHQATMNLIIYFQEQGDTEEAAKLKVKQVSAFIRTTSPGAKFDFRLGDTSALIEVINNISTDDLDFMTPPAKNQLLNILSNF